MAIVESSNLDLVRSYLAALEAGAVGDDLARFFTSDVQQIEFPNRLNPNGGRSDLPTLLTRAEKARDLLSHQRYEVRSAVAQEDRIAVEATWTAVLAVPLGALPAGASMTAHFAMFFEVEDGRIAVQRNYDCFEPLMLRPAQTAFWQRYLDTLPAADPHRSVQPDAFAFGDSPELARELAELVRAGKKRATTSLPAEYASLGEPLPFPGHVSVVTLADGEPVAIIEVVEIRRLPFHAVDAAFAAEEGEGDGSFAYWQVGHRDYFTRVSARLGLRFDDTTPVMCQRFRVLWPTAER